MSLFSLPPNPPLSLPSNSLKLTIPTIFTASPPEEFHTLSSPSTSLPSLSSSSPSSPTSSASWNSISLTIPPTNPITLPRPNPSRSHHQSLLKPIDAPSDSEISVLDLGPAFCRSASPSPSLILHLNATDNFSEDHIQIPEMQGLAVLENEIEHGIEQGVGLGMGAAMGYGFDLRPRDHVNIKTSKKARNNSTRSSIDEKDRDRPRANLERALGISGSFDRAMDWPPVGGKKKKRNHKTRRRGLHR